jgi:hypothetical protein
MMILVHILIFKRSKNIIIYYKMKTNKRAEKIMIQAVKETINKFSIRIFRAQKKERLFKLLVDIII